MKIEIGKGGETKVVTAFKEEEKVEKSNDLYIYLKEKEIFSGELGELHTDITPEKENIIFLGLGEKKKLTINLLRKAFYELGKELMKYKVENVGIHIEKFNDLCYEQTISAVVEGLLQSEYSFEKYLTEKKVKPTVKKVYLDIIANRKDDALQSIEEIRNIMEGVYLTRDLVNERAINMYPEVLANTAKKELGDLGVEVEILGEKEIRDLDMKAFLAVSKGSNKEPKFIIMNYNGDSSSDKKTALVGKGLTYDSGGYSLKTTDNMETMFIDMTGSACVIGAMKAIAKSKLKKNIVGIVAACENLVSGDAYKPGDIIGSMSGKTIEVINTDAEGRLTLADALWYTSTVIKPDSIVDLATLTYSSIAALGNISSAAITNNEDLMNEVIEASKLSGEPIWELPNFEEYKELNKSDYADLINDDNSGAGVSSSGLFLGEFVNNIPWVHLDIVGPSYNKKPRSYLPKGATGVNVKTLFYLVKNMNN